MSFYCTTPSHVTFHSFRGFVVDPYDLSHTLSSLASSSSSCSSFPYFSVKEIFSRVGSVADRVHCLVYPHLEVSFHSRYRDKRCLGWLWPSPFKRLIRPLTRAWTRWVSVYIHVLVHQNLYTPLLSPPPMESEGHESPTHSLARKMTEKLGAEPPPEYTPLPSNPASGVKAKTRPTPNPPDQSPQCRPNCEVTPYCNKVVISIRPPPSPILPHVREIYKDLRTAATAATPPGEWAKIEIEHYKERMIISAFLAPNGVSPGNNSKLQTVLKVHTIESLEPLLSDAQLENVTELHFLPFAKDDVSDQATTTLFEFLRENRESLKVANFRYNGPAGPKHTPKKISHREIPSFRHHIYLDNLQSFTHKWSSRGGKAVPIEIFDHINITLTRCDITLLEEGDTSLEKSWDDCFPISLDRFNHSVTAVDISVKILDSAVAMVEAKFSCTTGHSILLQKKVKIINYSHLAVEQILGFIKMKRMSRYIEALHFDFRLNRTMVPQGNVWSQLDDRSELRPKKLTMHIEATSPPIL